MTTLEQIGQKYWVNHGDAYIHYQDLPKIVQEWLECIQPVHLQDELTGKYDFYFNKKELLADLKPTEAQQ